MSGFEFNVGIIHGENDRFSARTSWPTSKLTVEAGSLVLTTGFKSMSFAKGRITRLSEYPGFTWVYARGVQIEHCDEKIPVFFVFWAFDLAPIKRSLAENGYIFSERTKSGEWGK